MPLSPLARTILQRCDELAAITDEPGVVTRGFLSPAMRRVDERMKAWTTELGLSTESDAAGNRIAVRKAVRDTAADADPPVLLIGSHLDTVRNAGRYDGILGVLLGLAVLERLGDEPLPFEIRLIAFSDEEGLRFQTPFLGSRAWIGDLDEELLARCDEQGVSMAEAIRAWDRDPADLPHRPPQRRWLGYVEAHIEQGPCLEERDLPLAILRAICGSCWISARFVGQADHAGTTPMSSRRDALPAAAEAVLEAERMAREDESMVATIGRLDAQPGAGNVIPGEVVVSLDVRHPDDDALRAAEARWLAFCRDVAARRGLRFEHEVLHRQGAAPADPRLSDMLRLAAEDVGAATCDLLCGAGHDALILSRIMPTAMLLLRCPGGLSHHPDEAVLPQDVDAALDVLTAFIRRLAATQQGTTS